MGCWDLPLGTEVLPVPTIVMALTPPSPVGRLAGLDQDPPSAVPSAGPGPGILVGLEPPWARELYKMV